MQSSSCIELWFCHYKTSVVVQVLGWDDREEPTAGPDSKPAFVINVTVGAYINQTIKAFTVDERLQPVTYQNIGRWFSGVRITLNPNRSLWARGYGISDVGVKAQNLCRALTFYFEINSNKWGVIDNDSNFFNRCHKNIGIAILAQNGREQANQFRAANGRTKVKPRPVTGDAYIQFAAIFLKMTLAL